MYDSMHAVWEGYLQLLVTDYTLLCYLDMLNIAPSLGYEKNISSICFSNSEANYPELLEKFDAKISMLLIIVCRS